MKAIDSGASKVVAEAHQSDFSPKMSECLKDFRLFVRILYRD